MSWSISIGPTPVKELKRSLDVAEVHGADSYSEDVRDQVDAQIAHAKKAVLAALKAKTVGDPHSVYVSLTGHVFDGASIDNAAPSSFMIVVSEAPVSLEPAEVEDTGEGPVDEAIATDE